MVGQYQNTAEINGGTGIVVIGLACLIIGETVLGRRGVARGVIATVIGSIIYRFIYAIVLYTKIMPVQGLKLVTAVIVALAIGIFRRSGNGRHSRHVKMQRHAGREDTEHVKYSVDIKNL